MRQGDSATIAAQRPWVLPALTLLLALFAASPACALEVHYRTTWSAPRIHFDAGKGWTRSPGTAMAAEGDGWWRFDLPGARAEFVFNDGRGVWDNNGGRNYQADAGPVWVARGEVHARRPEGGGLVEEAEGPRGRRLSVYLPPDYPGGTRRYPVLYLLDGQNLFSRGAPHGGWDAAGAADRQIAAGAVEPLLIVGVWNSPARIDEYTFVADAEHGGGKGAAHLAWLVDELKPFVDRRWRTRPGAEETGIGGSSLGGLFALEAGLARPDRFRRVLAMSPSCWWSERALVKRLEGGTGKPRPPLALYLDAGDAKDGLADTESARAALLRWGFVAGKDLVFAVGKGQSHNEASWRERLPGALAALFPARAGGGGGR